MKRIICQLIFIVWSNSINAQLDTFYWNNSMLRLVESTSSEGWLKIKDGLNFYADSFFLKNKDAFGLGSESNMELIQVWNDDLGYNHYKFQQKYKDLKIEGAEYILHEKDNRISFANGRIVNDIEINTIPVLSKSEALNKALNEKPAEKYGWEVLKNSSGEYYSNVPEGTLVIGKIGNADDVNYELAYQFEIYTIAPEFAKWLVFVDAENGDILKSINLMETNHCDCCQGATITLHHGSQYITTEHRGFPIYNYELIDNCRGNGIQAFKNGNEIRDPNNNFVNNHEEIVGASVLWAAEITYDYFYNIFGRNSFDNYGSKINLYTTHEINGNLFKDNAKFDGTDFYFGAAGSSANSDLVSLDVTGHEITHAVTKYTAGLIYSYESGALNESFSDIFGSMIENYGLYGNGNYLIGEDFWIADGKLRDMQNPNSKNHPDTYNGLFWETGSFDNGGVHINSGVQNYWFYLLSEGGVGINDFGNNYNVIGIGRDKAAAISYRNLTTYLISSSDFSDAKNGSIWAAIDLFGICSNEVLQVIKAWDAVGVSSATGINFDKFVNCSELNYIINQNQDYNTFAINLLQSDCEVINSNTSVVRFISGNSIQLLPGFSSGQKFSAFIDPCLSSIQLRNSQEIYESTIMPVFHLNDNNEALDENSDLFLKVFPNPTNGELNISFTAATKLNFIKLYDQYGKNILNSNSEIGINLNSFSNGIYFLEINTDKGIFMEKVLKY